MPNRGKFIVLEGPDGAGKSEMARRMFARVADRVGPGARFTREPTDGPIGALIRQALRHEVTLAPAAMAPLYAADRLHHVATTIKPALARGEVVVCDRYELSNLVYRAAEIEGSCYCRGMQISQPESAAWCAPCAVRIIAAYSAIEYARALSRGVTRPDLTIVMTAPLDVCAARRRTRGGKRELFDGDALQARVHALYADAQRLLPGERVAMIDASGSAEDVEERVWCAVEEVIGGE